MLAALLLVAVGIAWQAVATVRSIDDPALANQAQMLAGQISQRAANGPVVPDAVRAMFAGSGGASIYLVTDTSERVFDSSEPAIASALLPYAHSLGFFHVPRSAAFPSGLLGYALANDPWRILVVQRNEQHEQIASTDAPATVTRVWTSFRPIPRGGGPWPRAG